MNPLRLTAENYRTFRDLDLRLPEGCTAVLGENGAGKSSIVQIIDLCLFAGRGELGQHLSDADTGDLMIGLEFEHGGQLYRVRRTYVGRGRGKTTLDFEEALFSTREGYTDDAWTPLTRDKADETQKLIEQTLGLSRETFRASAFLAQGDGAAFTEAQPRDRKRILAEVLGLDVYDRLEDKAKAARREADLDLAGLDTATAALREQVAAKPDQEARLRTLTAALTVAEQAVARAEGEIVEAEQKHEAAKHAAAELAVAEEQATAAAERFQTLDKVREDAEAATGEAAIVEATIARVAERAAGLDDLEKSEQELRSQVDAHAHLLREHDAAMREHDLKLSQRNAILGQANDLNEKAHALREEAKLLEENGPGAAHCDRCGQTLGAEALASTLASMRTDADELDAAAKDLDAQAAAVELPEVGEKPAGDAPTAEHAIAAQKLRDARDAAGEKRVLEERLGNIRQRIGQAEDAVFVDEHRQAGDQLVLARSRVAVLTEACPTSAERLALADAVVEARDRIADHRRAVTDTTAQKAVVEERLNRVAEAEEKVAEAETRRVELLEEIDLLAALERAYGRDGIPALIVENAAVPAIEVEASRILAELGTSYRVELRTQAELKSGEGLRDTLDVVVVGDHGERPYETFSGGERTRLNLALRIALARLLAHRRGAESRLLAIDEPEFLDEAGVGKLADVLRGLLDDFDKILLISHVPALREAFDETLLVVKDEGGRSRVEGYADIEAVAA